MTEKQFIKDVSTKYPYAFSLAPIKLWEWIYRNYINNNHGKS